VCVYSRFSSIRSIMLVNPSRQQQVLELASRPEVLQLFSAVESNNRPELLRIIRRETKDVLKRRNVDSQTVLHVAAARGHSELFEFLVDKYQINPNPTDAHGCTPLHVGATFGRLDLLDFLLSKEEVSIGALTSLGECVIHCLAKAHYDNMNHLLQVLERMLQEGRCVRLSVLRERERVSVF
jgi:ankyrin repeat protein